MKQGLKLVAVAASTLILTACASMHSGTTQEVKISSNPEGATVYVGVATLENDVPGIINQVKMGVTPLTLKLSRKSGAIELQKEGFATVRVPMNKTMNPWVWGDILLTSPLSTSIDTSTGAAYEYDPGEYMIEMKPASK
jgi:hypothetical protein